MLKSVARDFGNARIKTGLSRKEVARRAGVSLTTVSRTESGEMDPTITMLQRLYSALDLRVALSTGPLFEPSIATLSNALTQKKRGIEIDYLKIRIFVDYVTGRPTIVEDAIAQPPRRSGFDRLDCLLAALAEKLADDAGIDRPKWCGTVPALVCRFTPPGTPMMNKRAAASAPSQFRKRNIYLSSLEFWRPTDW